MRVVYLKGKETALGLKWTCVNDKGKDAQEISHRHETCLPMNEIYFIKEQREKSGGKNISSV